MWYLVIDICLWVAEVLMFSDFFNNIEVLNRGRKRHTAAILSVCMGMSECGVGSGVG